MHDSPRSLKSPPCPWLPKHLQFRGSKRSKPCSPSSQPRPKEKTKTASHVFSRVSREKDRELHLPEAVCSDNWAQTTSVPAVPAVWVLATLHTCVVVRAAMCLLSAGLCVKSPGYYGLSLLQSHTLIPRWSTGHSRDLEQEHRWVGTTPNPSIGKGAWGTCTAKHYSHFSLLYNISWAAVRCWRLKYE